jgi:G3E family GTPase
MKLRFRATLLAAYWPRWEQLSDCKLSINKFCVAFKLKDKWVDEKKEFLKIPLEIDVPNVEVYKAELDTPIEGRKYELDPYKDEKSYNQAYSLAAYIADVLQRQTHFCELLSISPIDYIKETEEDEDLLKNSIVKVQSQATFSWRTGGGSIDLTEQALNRYWNHRELLHIEAHAMRLDDPISKYRELYRVLDYAEREAEREIVGRKRQSPSPQKRSKPNKKDKHLAKFIASSPEEESELKEKFCKLRELRNQCSHAYNDFITYGNMEGLKKIKESLPELEEIVRRLEEKLLSQLEE